MTQLFSGRCKCGSFSYESTSEIMGAHFCHCKDCQSLYGGPFGAGFAVLEEQTQISGELSRYTMSTDAGHVKTHLFCGKCGSPVGEQVDIYPGVIVFVPGTLDDPALFKPEMHLWVSSKQPWVSISDGLPQHDQQPDFSESI